ncbi:gamma-glutamylcyclotransferase family protein [Metamycoplasma equirhinis]|uniref:gamma-glutamylcyclotransferase family protein n=1 Tax=Metamycoplasma equirhinis TaxID=92402 RepID=UPI0035942BF5
MTDEKIYVFGYGTIQEPLFYENLLGKNVVRHAATLNGYAKCVDETMYFLLKKDMASQVKGTVFEISKDQLFMIDRWEMYPQYQRFQVNVLLNDTNEMLENVYVYTKLETGKYFLATDDLPFSKDPSSTDENVNAFVTLENARKNMPISDTIFLYEISKEKHDEIRALSHPYLALILDDSKNKLFQVDSCVLFAIQEKGKYYATLTSFGNKNGLNSVHYYNIFNNKIEDLNAKITYKPLYDFDIKFLEENKPNYYLSHREESDSENKVGWFENMAFELVSKSFNLDPLKRYDEILSAFFGTLK